MDARKETLQGAHGDAKKERRAATGVRARAMGSAPTVFSRPCAARPACDLGGAGGSRPCTRVRSVRQIAAQLAPAAVSQPVPLGRQRRGMGGVRASSSRGGNSGGGWPRGGDRADGQEQLEILAEVAAKRRRIRSAPQLSTCGVVTLFAPRQPRCWGRGAARRNCTCTSHVRASWPVTVAVDQTCTLCSIFDRAKTPRLCTCKACAHTCSTRRLLVESHLIATDSEEKS